MKYGITLINRIVFKTSKLFTHFEHKMKAKKQKDANNNSAKKHNSSNGLFAPPHKEFELMYRTCDRLPSSEEYQSVFFVKRKKITPNEQPLPEAKKNKKKKQSSKKKKIDQKHIFEQYSSSIVKAKQTFFNTKTTMPSSTMGAFKKSSFAQTFKEKIELDKSKIRKVHNLSNSNSSRYLNSKYLNKEEKTPNKKGNAGVKNLPKSPSKNIILSSKVTNVSNKSIQRDFKNSHKLKDVKSKRGTNDKIVEDGDYTNQYIFLDGEYLHMDNPVSQILTQKMLSGKLSSKRNLSNQFITDIEKMKPNFQQKMVSAHSKKFSQFQQKSDNQEDSQISDAHDFVLNKIIFIQRWWRSYQKKLAVLECNNKRHFPSNAESERTLSESQNSPMISQISDPGRHLRPYNKQVKQEDNQNIISVRESLLFSDMQYQKQILNKMFELRKIDSGMYSESLKKVQSNFQKEMLEINKLKQKIEAQAEKTQELKNKLKQKSDLIREIQNIPTNQILEQFFSIQKQSKQSNAQQINISNAQYKRQKSTGCHYSSLSEQNEKNQQHKSISYRKSDNHKVQKQQSNQSTLNSEEHKQNFQNEVEDESDNEGEGMQGIEVSVGHESLNQMLEMYADRQLAQSQIEKRYAAQLGMGFQFSGLSKSGISTSVVSVHNFLSNFLKFYEYFYKDQFLKLVNLPYGINQSSRMKLIQGYDSKSWVKPNGQNASQEDQELFFEVQSIISQDILDDFQQHNYQLPENIDDDTRAIVYFEKIHQRAIIDSFNQSLNCFRPYYFINGAPYSWNYSQKALTFYFIAQENIQQVFQKTQYKILKNASCLCGTIVEPLMKRPEISEQMSLQQKLAKYRQSTNPILTQGRQQKLNKLQKQEIEQTNFKWQYFDEEKTGSLFNISNLVFEELINQILYFKPIGYEQESVSVIGSQKTCQSHETSSSTSSYCANGNTQKNIQKSSNKSVESSENTDQNQNYQNEQSNSQQHSDNQLNGEHDEQQGDGNECYEDHEPYGNEDNEDVNDDQLQAIQFQENGQEQGSEGQQEYEGGLEYEDEQQPQP